MHHELLKADMGSLNLLTLCWACNNVGYEDEPVIADGVGDGDDEPVVVDNLGNEDEPVIAEMEMMDELVVANDITGGEF